MTARVTNMHRLPGPDDERLVADVLTDSRAVDPDDHFTVADTLRPAEMACWPGGEEDPEDRITQRDEETAREWGDG